MFIDLKSALVEALAAPEVRTALRAALAEGTPAPTTAEEAVSIARAAEITGTHPGTVRRWIKERRIPALHAGRHIRLRVEDLRAFMQGATDAARRPQDVANEVLGRRRGG